MEENKTKKKIIEMEAIKKIKMTRKESEKKEHTIKTMSTGDGTNEKKQKEMD